MASERSLNAKKAVVSEFSGKLDNNKTLLVVEYTGLTDTANKQLRKQLREIGADIKVYKNNLVEFSLKDKNIDLTEHMTGQNAYLFSNDIIEPIKLVSNFAKENEALKIKVGYIGGEVVGLDTIKTYATIPSMEGLLTQFAGGLMQHVRDLSIAIDLYSKQKEGGEK